MDAETCLRRIAESALLRTCGSDWDRLSGFLAVQRALTVTGALSAETAATIETDLRIALHAREPRREPPPRSRHWPLRRRSQRHAAYRGAFAGSAVSAATRVTSHRRPPAPPSAPPPAPPDRAIPLAATLPVRTAELSGELHLLSYVHARSGALLAFAGRLAGKGTHRLLLHQLGFPATDDQGNHYELCLGSASSTANRWSGELILRPDPPPDLRWLDLDHGAVRLDLTPVTPAPDITSTAVALPPGEQYLHAIAAGWLAGGLSADPELIVTALREGGVLAPDSAVPAQLAALRAGTDTGIPARWRLAPVPPRAQRRYGGLAAILPELDGIQYTLHGLLTEQDGDCQLLVGMTGAVGWDCPPWPIWLRDQDGWHATTRGSGGGSETEARYAYLVVPPLRPHDWVEVIVTGKGAEVRARLAVRWRNADDA